MMALSELQNLKNQVALMDAVLIILSHTPHPILGDCHTTMAYAELKRCLESVKDQVWVLEHQDG